MVFVVLAFFSAGQMLSQGRMPANMSDVPPDML